MAQVFKTQFKVKFRDGDPAQIMYFGNLFSFAHDAFEEFIVAAGYAWSEWFRGGDLMIPIRHAESNFLAPFTVGQTYDIAVTVAQIRDTSFQMKYVFTKDGRKHAELTMVHAILDAKKMSKAELPAQMRERLTAYLEVQV
jgi:acyl-CoA thioester hydrolase/1,4-dihydroxy-2-naphthoyl-CoA hydrolase